MVDECLDDRPDNLGHLLEHVHDLVNDVPHGFKLGVGSSQPTYQKDDGGHHQSDGIGVHRQGPQLGGDRHQFVPLVDQDESHLVGLEGDDTCEDRPAEGDDPLAVLLHPLNGGAESVGDAPDELHDCFPHLLKGGEEVFANLAPVGGVELLNDPVDAHLDEVNEGVFYGQDLLPQNGEAGCEVFSGSPVGGHELLSDPTSSVRYSTKDRCEEICHGPTGVEHPCVDRLDDRHEEVLGLLGEGDHGGLDLGEGGLEVVEPLEYPVGGLGYQRGEFLPNLDHQDLDVGLDAVERGPHACVHCFKCALCGPS